MLYPRWRSCLYGRDRGIFASSLYVSMYIITGATILGDECSEYIITGATTLGDECSELRMESAPAWVPRQPMLWSPGRAACLKRRGLWLVCLVFYFCLLE